MKRLIFFVLFLFFSFSFGTELISENYALILTALLSGSGEISSQNYNIVGVLGQGVCGYAKNDSYKNEAGYIPQLEAVVSLSPAFDLKEVYVYPNPLKLNSPSNRFYSDRITFKRLPVDATIKIFTITGEIVATIEKSDPTVDYYEWFATNNSGEKLASGVYIYFITTPQGEKAKGKFAIIK